MLQPHDHANKSHTASRVSDNPEEKMEHKHFNQFQNQFDNEVEPDGQHNEEMGIFQSNQRDVQNHNDKINDERYGFEADSRNKQYSQDGRKEHHHNHLSEKKAENQQQNKDKSEEKNYNSMRSQEYEMDSLKQHYNKLALANPMKFISDLSQQKYENFEKQSQKYSDSPFMWGQDEDDTRSQKKRTYSHLYVNNNLAKNFNLFGKDILEQINRQKYEKLPNIKQKKQKQVNDNLDIWSGLKKSMSEKKIIAPRFKANKNNNALLKSESAHLINQKNDAISYENGINEEKKIRKYNSVNVQAFNNIQSLNKIISGKVKHWMHEQKAIQERRLRKIAYQNEKRKHDQLQELEKSEKKKREQIKNRVRQISERLQAKKYRVKHKQMSPTPKSSKKPQSHKNNKIKKSKSIDDLRSIEKVKFKSRSIKLPKLEEKVLPREFSMHWNSRNDSMAEKQKAERRKIFIEKIRNIPVRVDEQKKISMLIKADKDANPLKYNLLSKKGLNDYEIYQSYKNFKVPETSKKIGIQYLQQIREQHKDKDLRRFMREKDTGSSSISSIYRLQNSLQI